MTSRSCSEDNRAPGRPHPHPLPLRREREQEGALPLRPVREQDALPLSILGGSRRGVDDNLENRLLGREEAVIIKPVAGWTALNLAEVWRYRDLLYFLTWRDLKVRYKQTAIGVAWALLQPFLAMVVFSLIFGLLAGLPSDGVPYPVFSFAGLLPWTFFATAISRSGASLVSDANLISKVYFPRLIVPVAATLATTVDFLIAFALLLGLMLFYGIRPGVGALGLPFFVLLALLAALGAGFWLAALNVKYRDIVHVLPFLTQFWLFVTPVAYSSSIIPEQWRLPYSLNPLAGVVEGFRWTLLGEERIPGTMIFMSAVVIFALFASGIYYFRRVEYEFADVI